MITIQNFAEAVDAIAQMEGPAWKRGEERGGERSQYSLSCARQRWEERQQDIANEPDPTWKTEMLKNSVGVSVYGEGGWHRYYVMGSGEVVFSSFHASPEKRKAAEAIGFRLF